MGPVVGAVDGRLVAFVDVLRVVGQAVDHVQAELSVVAVVGDRLVAVGHGVDGAGHVLAAGMQDHRVGIPGEGAAGDLLQLRRVRRGGRLHIGVVVAAHALDAQRDTRIDVVDVAVAARLEHATATVEPIQLHHLGLPGSAGGGLFAFGQAGVRHIARQRAAGILYAIVIAALADHVDLRVDGNRLLIGRRGRALVNVGILADIGRVPALHI